MNLSFYGLLHLAENQTCLMDFYAKTYIQKRRFYLNSAINLAHSLRASGIDFTLLTNRQQELIQDLAELGQQHALKVETIDFQTYVPDGLFYYSTHFKLDVFRYFATLAADRYVGLIDLDMIALGEMPAALRNLAAARVPVGYDVSDQLIPAFGHGVILRDMQRLSPEIDEGRWYGGELIMGTPDFFAALHRETSAIYPRYLETVDQLFHKGDEMITSVALAKLRQQGRYLVDAGTLGIVGRYFSSPAVRHPQKSFRYFEQCFLLHLPVDKEFLAQLNPERAQSGAAFLRHYKAYLSTVWLRRGVKKLDRLGRALLIASLDRLKAIGRKLNRPSGLPDSPNQIVP